MLVSEDFLPDKLAIRVRRPEAFKSATSEETLTLSEEHLIVKNIPK